MCWNMGSIFRLREFIVFLPVGLCEGQNLYASNAKLQALQERITAALTEINRNMPLKVWMKLDFRWDVCRLIKGAHIERL